MLYDWDGFHIVYAPVLNSRTRKAKGNGSKSGCPAGHRGQLLNSQGSVLNKNGCMRHNSTDCFNCPRAAKGLDCDWNYDTEQRLRAKQK